MKHLMIDIETLGVKKDCVILSIAMVVYSEAWEIEESHYWNCSFVDQIFDRKIEEKTLQFWKERKDIFQQTQHMALPLKQCLEEVIEEVSKIKKESFFLVWSKSPSFDITILEHAAEQEGLKFPWSYSQQMDVRTGYMFLDRLGVEQVHPDKAHNALEDCYSQGTNIKALFNAILS